ncbi:MAG: 16S rRNA (uracil(1498)-N(3))-methyltransferase [Elainella sp.]
MAQLQRLAIAAEQVSGQTIALTAAQQHYLGRVLRLRNGDRFIALLGAPSSAQASPESSDQPVSVTCWWLAEFREMAAELLEPVFARTELVVAVTLLLALPKAGMEDVVRQATELGVQTIVPVLSQRSLLKPSPQKQERWQRIAQEAAEQSERQFIPQIVAPLDWPTALQTHSHGRCYLCEARGDHPHLLCQLMRDWQQGSTQLSAMTLAVGPEGGWTEAEIAQAIAHHYQPVSLGARVLRSVTAPLAALALLAGVTEAEGFNCS